MATASFHGEDAFHENLVPFIGDGIDVEAEDTSGDDRITEPFNPALIRVHTQHITIDLLLSRIIHEELDLQPSFQRKGGIWNTKTQSRLIESILIRIPLPAFFPWEEKRLIIIGYVGHHLPTVRYST